MASSKYNVPIYQRKYSWRLKVEVEDFWNDLKSAQKEEAYFMGIIILTAHDSDYQDIVDGQQRLISLSLLANAIRLLAVVEKKPLIKRSIRDSLLIGPDYQKDQEVPRLKLNDEKDLQVYDQLLSLDKPEWPSGNDLSNHPMVSAQRYLYEQLKVEIDNGPSFALSDWAKFLTEKVYLSAFVNDDLVSAYKVFEVVNARGRNLTPYDIIKAYVLGSLNQLNEEEIRENKLTDKWIKIQEKFEAIGAEDQLTHFIRHILILRHGYILPRDLYKIVIKYYPGEKVSQLIELLYEHLDRYLGLIDPSLVDNSAPSNFVRISAILDQLNFSTIRPIVIAISYDEQADFYLEELSKIVITRMVVGMFGTGSIEAKFAKAAQNIFQSEHSKIDKAIDSLKELKPSKEQFVERLKARPLQRKLATVVRLSALQESCLPDVDAFLHIVMRNVSIKNNLSSNQSSLTEQYKLLRNIGNTILLKTENRPYGSTDVAKTAEHFKKHIYHREIVNFDDLKCWDVESINQKMEQIVKECSKTWYGEEYEF